MTDSEFFSRLPENIRRPSQKEFDLIQLVYNYHPSISPVNGKDQIAMLYSNFGMRIISDMLETAKRAQEIDYECCKLRSQLEQLKDEMRELAMT